MGRSLGFLDLEFKYKKYSSENKNRTIDVKKRGQIEVYVPVWWLKRGKLHQLVFLK